VQGLLEEACYSFGQQKMPQLLHEKQWRFPEAVELNYWALNFHQNEKIFDSQRVSDLGKPFHDFLDSVAQLRHTAGHRLHVSASRVQQFLLEAELLANLLQDSICARKMACLRFEVQQLVDEMGRNKDLLEAVLKERVAEIDARRRELDALERKAIADMFREDEEYQALASSNFEQAIHAPTTVLHSASASEHDSNSETDTEIEDFDCLSVVHQGVGEASSSSA
jgi:hypothetical protein